MPLGQRKDRHKLDHFAKQLVDLGLPAAEVTSLHEVVHLLPPPSSGVVQLARPQKVGGVPEEKNFKYILFWVLNWNSDEGKINQAYHLIITLTHG